jgi:hypothetical protein
MTTTGFPSAPAIRLRSTRDVLAAIPYLLGFRPAECAVVVCMTGEGRLGPIAHVKLAELPLAGRTGMRTVARRAAQTGARRAVVAVYIRGEDSSLGGSRRAVEPLLAELDQALGDVDAWLVTPTGFRGLDCSDPACCPPGGHPRDELESGVVSAAFVLSGSGVAPTAADAFRIPRAPSAARGLVGRAARRWERAGDAAAGATARRAWRRDGLSAWREALRHATTEQQLIAADDDMRPQPPAPIPPATLGRLAAALADTEVRDSVLLALVKAASDGTGHNVPAKQENETEHDAEREAAEACALLIDPGAAVVPDRATTTAARAVLEAVVAHVPRRLQAAPLTLLGLVAWWQGEGGLAGARVREAVDVDEDYRLAALLSDVLAAAIPPGWVRRSSV